SAGSSPPSTPVRIRHVAPDAFAVVAVSGLGKSLAQGWTKVAGTSPYDQLAQQAAAVGLTLPHDLEALLGDQLTVSVGAGTGNEPSVLAAATSAHPEA